MIQSAVVLLLLVLITMVGCAVIPPILRRRTVANAIASPTISVKATSARRSERVTYRKLTAEFAETRAAIWAKRRVGLNDGMPQR